MKEAEEVKSNAKLVKQDKVPAIPYLLFVSNGQGTGFARKGWQDMSKTAKDRKNVQLKIFDVFLTIFIVISLMSLPRK